MYDTSTARWMSRDPLGFEGSGINIYEYVRSSPATLIDPSGQKLVETCAKKCAGYQRGNAVFDVVVSHHFLDIEGVGLGFFEQDLNACGTGVWRKDDLRTYPPTDDYRKVPAGDWYSICEPIKVQDYCFDPSVFCTILKACVAKAQANPGNYCVVNRNCNTEITRCVREALEASLKVKGGWAEYCKGQSGWFPVRPIPPGDYGPPPWNQQ